MPFGLGASARGSTANISQPPYNAAGDGVTDDAAAIQAAINAMAAGGTVTGQAGKTYVIGTTLSFASTTDLTFDLTGCTLKVKDAAAAGVGIHALEGFSGTLRLTIRGVRINGNRAGNGSATVGQGIRFANTTASNHVLIENCYIFNTVQHGISLSGKHFRISRCLFDDTFNAAINVNSSGQQVMVSQCQVLSTATTNTADAISCQGTKCTFIGNRLTSTDTGLNLAGQGHIATENECFLNGNSGINSGGGDNLIITNNICYANGRKTAVPRSNAGIRIRDHSTNVVTSNNLIVKGNRCYDDTTTYSLTAGAVGQLYGIEIVETVGGHGAPDDLTITGNDLTGNVAAAIQPTNVGPNVIIEQNIGATSLSSGDVVASVTAKGVNKLSTTPAVPADPIAVSDNDPRVTGVQPSLTAPASLTATPSNTAVTLNWSAGGGPNLIGYNIYRRNTDLTWPTTPTAQTNVPVQQFQDTGLTNGTTYAYRVTSRSSTAQSPPSVEVTAVPPGNIPPTASFTFTPASPTTGQTITLTSTSTDSDGTISALATQWDFTNDGTFDASGFSATTSYGTTGTKTVRLRVTDNMGAITETTQNIIVAASPPANVPPTASFTFSPASPQVGQLVTFTSTSTDTDGTISAGATEWDWDNSGTTDATGFSQTFTFTAAGQATVRLKVTDNLGGVAQTTQTITVASTPPPANVPPTAAFHFVPITAQLTGTQLIFTSDSTDSDGTITNTEWDFDNNGTFEVQGSPANHTFTTPGVKPVSIRVTDNSGAQSIVSHDVTVTNRVPIPSFTFSPASPVAGQTVTFNSTSTDADGVIVTTEWDFDNSGSGATGIDATGATGVQHVYSTAGTYTARLRVTDDSGGIAETTRSVVVSAAPSDPYVTAVTADTPVMWLRLGELAGATVAQDETVNNLDATQSGGLTFGAPGAVAGNTAVTLDGTNDYLEVADNNLLDMGDTFSLECWAKRAVVGVQQSLMSKDALSYIFRFEASNVITLRKSTVGDIANTGAFTITDTNWHHIVVTKAGATFKIYVDGTDRTSTVGNQTIENNALPLRIGAASGASPSQFFNGSLDEVAVYSQALSAARVTAHHDAAVVTSNYRTEVLADTPRLYWRVGESSGTSLADETANALTGTAVGGVTLGVTGALGSSTNTAVTLNGTTGYLERADNNLLDTADVFTVELWFKRAAIDGLDHILITKGARAYKVTLLANNTLRLRMPGVADIVDSTAQVTDTGWHHLAVTKNAGTVKMYLDKNDVTGTVANQTIENSADVLRIGADVNPTEKFFNGSIDEVAIFPTALSAARIGVHYDTASPAAPPPPPPPVSTVDKAGWIGNTGPGLNGVHVQHSGKGFYVHPDGTAFTDHWWEESSHQCRAYKLGTGTTPTILGPFLGPNGGGGGAVCADNTYVYMAAGNYDYGKRVSRFLRSEFENPANRTSNNSLPSRVEMNVVPQASGVITGMAVANGELYVAIASPLTGDTQDRRGPYESTVIQVYDANLFNNSVKRSWSVPRCRHISVERNGQFLWVLQQAQISGAVAKAARYTIGGVLQSQSITETGTQVFLSLACDPSADRLLISDNGPDQNIKIYNNITTTPALQTTFGVTGGYLSTAGGAVKGSVGDLRFDGPQGCGIDSSGNIYVMQTRLAGLGKQKPWASLENGRGVIIESYNGTTQALRWRAHGICFGDTGGLDPGSDTDVYDKNGHYTVNLDTDPVSWTYKGRTLDPFAYPNDHRIVNWTSTDGSSIGGCWTRRFNGGRFLFMSNQDASEFKWYRLGSDEIAIPAGSVSTVGSHYIWIDGSGGNLADGTDQGATERVTGTGNPFYAASWYPDSTGAIWCSDGQTTRRHRMLGLNTAGNPTYNYGVNQLDTWAPPAPFIYVARMDYKPTLNDGTSTQNDVMFISGWTALPAGGAGAAVSPRGGNTIARYNNWTGAGGARTLVWQITGIPDVFTDNFMQTFAADGAYVVTNQGFNPTYYNVYRADTGAFVRTLGPPFFNAMEVNPPDAVRGALGGADCRSSSFMFQKRANGRYVGFAEEVFMSKILTMQFS